MPAVERVERQLDLRFRRKVKYPSVVAVPMEMSQTLDLKDLAKKLGGVPVAEIMRVAAKVATATGERVPDGGTIFDLERLMREPKVKPPRARPARNETRDRVLEAWRAGLLEREGEDPMLVDVATRAGVSPQAARYHIVELERDGRLKRRRVLPPGKYRRE